MSNAGAWIGLMITLFAGFIFYQSLFLEYSGSYGPGPGFFSIWLSGLLMICAVVYTLSTLKNKGIDWRDILPRGIYLHKVLTIFAALILFLISVPFLGYGITSLLMLSILFFGEYRWYTSLGLSVLITATIFYLFKILLDVPLPVNSLGF
ncbi:MAG: tripartite tricarboxylate transporter TctB family protein [Negativicutes bacterium]